MNAGTSSACTQITIGARCEAAPAEANTSTAGSGIVTCKKFIPKSYVQEQRKLRKKLCEFAFRVLREV